MIELLRNCNHWSETAVYLETQDDSGKRTATKTATTAKGIQALKQEIAGWEWYQDRRYPGEGPKCRIVQERESYLKIQVDFIEGAKANYRKGLAGNAEIVKAIVQQYCDLWPSSPEMEFPIHGDLSIDNVIINADGIHILDWEHFTLNGDPWGYDVAYLLFETLWFGMRRRERPTKNEIDIIAVNLKTLNARIPLQLELIERPLKFLRDFMTQEPDRWTERSSLLSSKFPIIKFADSQVSLIDRSVCNRLQKTL